jgi:hypothetical protein
VTEAEWLTSTEPAPMLDFLPGRATDRKLRLFLVACARLVLDRLPPGEIREAVEVGEGYADGLRSNDERQRLSERLYVLPRERGRSPGGDWVARCSREDMAAYLSAQLTVHRPGCSSRVTSRVSWWAGSQLTGPQQPGLLREVFGNPFRPVPFDPSWRSPAAVALASAMYESRAFDRMPETADALMDAGCDDEQVLGHCRGAGPHVRGCWMVDLILGRD